MILKINFLHNIQKLGWFKKTSYVEVLFLSIFVTTLTVVLSKAIHYGYSTENQASDFQKKKIIHKLIDFAHIQCNAEDKVIFCYFIVAFIWNELRDFL
jgi:hypothetical protein